MEFTWCTVEVVLSVAPLQVIRICSRNQNIYLLALLSDGNESKILYNHGKPA